MLIIIAMHPTMCSFLPPKVPIWNYCILLPCQFHSFHLFPFPSMFLQLAGVASASQATPAITRVSPATWHISFLYAKDSKRVEGPQALMPRSHCLPSCHHVIIALRMLHSELNTSNLSWGQNVPVRSWIVCSGLDMVFTPFTNIPSWLHAQSTPGGGVGDCLILEMYKYPRIKQEIVVFSCGTMKARVDGRVGGKTQWSKHTKKDPVEKKACMVIQRGSCETYYHSLKQNTYWDTTQQETKHPKVSTCWWKTNVKKWQLPMVHCKTSVCLVRKAYAFLANPEMLYNSEV